MYGFRTAAAAMLLLTACKFECSLGGGDKIKGAKLAGFVREKLAAVYPDHGILPLLAACAPNVSGW